MNEFLIIKYFVKARLAVLGSGIEYAKETATKRTSKANGDCALDYDVVINEIPKQDALEIIREYGMRVTHRNEYGTIWDSGEFQSKYKGNIYIPRDR